MKNQGRLGKCHLRPVCVLTAKMLDHLQIAFDRPWVVRVIPGLPGGLE